MGIKIITNHHPRAIVHGWSLTDAENASLGDNNDSAAEYVRYRGRVIPISDFGQNFGIRDGLSTPEVFRVWPFYVADDYFSGLVLRYTEDDGMVVVGRYVTTEDTAIVAGMVTHGETGQIGEFEDKHLFVESGEQGVCARCGDNEGANDHLDPDDASHVWMDVEGITAGDIDRLNDLSDDFPAEVVAAWVNQGGDYANDGAVDRLARWVGTRTND